MRRGGGAGSKPPAAPGGRELIAVRACMVAYTYYETDNRVRRYAETLAKRGDEVDAVVVGRAGQVPFEVIRGVRIHRIQTRVRNERQPAEYLWKLVTFLLRSFWRLTFRHLRERYDLIHVHSVPDFEVFAALIPRLLGARVILDIHDIVPELYASKFKIRDSSAVFRLLVLIERLSIAFSHHVIIANHLWREKLIRRSAPARKCSAIINYPDPDIFFPRDAGRRAGDGFVMCYPGTLNWHQGLDQAVCAVARLRDEAPELKLLIMGDGPELTKLKAMVREHRLEDRVSITGPVPMEKVAEAMANVDLGVVPKRADSFGNEAFSTKILEFMAMGVPVVASGTRIDRYYFNDRLVQFFESGNVEDLAAKILELIRNPAKRKALRENAAAFIAANNWNVKRHEYLDLVDRLVAAGRPGRVVARGESCSD